MTAEVGVLNKSCVVLAADSAVTISSKNKSKVFNKANKVFLLNEEDSIGIMVFSNAEYMGIPVETIIKLYRQQNKGSLPTVTDHVATFLAWLKENRALFPARIQDEYMRSEAISFLKDKICAGYVHQINSKGIVKKTERKKTFYKIVDDIFTDMAQKNIGADFTDAEISLIEKEFCNYAEKLTSAEYIDFSLSKQYQKKISIILSSVITRTWYNNGYTGFVFAGFGNQEHFPSLYAIRSSGIFKNKINYDVLDNIQISHDNISDLKVYAQSDMADTFINGAHPDTLNFIQYRNKLFNYILQKFANTLSPPHNKLLSDLVEKVTSRFENDLTNFIVQNHRQHIYGMLDLMPKEELAEFAESLINITHMKQLVSTEQETVGGPVDIAVISKGDGLVWIKRKHYFPPEINQKYIAKLYT